MYFFVQSIAIKHCNKIWNDELVVVGVVEFIVVGFLGRVSLWDGWLHYWNIEISSTVTFLLPNSNAEVACHVVILMIICCTYLSFQK